MDFVRLNNIVMFAHLGVSEAEREVGQRIRLDLDLGTDLSAASASDVLADTTSYESVYKTVEKVVNVSRHKLLETLAGDLISSIFDSYPKVSRIQVRIQKLNVPFAGTVASAEVELTRDR